MSDPILSLFDNESPITSSESITDFVVSDGNFVHDPKHKDQQCRCYLAMAVLVISFCFCRKKSHYSLQNFLPDLAVVEGVIPAHLHGTHNDVLPEDIRAQLSVQLLTLTERNMIYAQHEA